ncbi:MAG: hypothetical protein JXD21_04870 [Candidatus Omnitrophica bacterium]|nr:hypothetical protein [Candidatus Omnitrophota bacterium]
MKYKYSYLVLAVCAVVIAVGMQNSFCRPPDGLYREAEELSQSIIHQRQFQKSGVERMIEMEMSQPQPSLDLLESEQSLFLPDAPQLLDEKDPGPAAEIVLPSVNAEEIPQEKEAAVVPDVPQQKTVDLNFTDANIEDVLRVIAAGEQFNIVVDPMVKGKKIDLHIKDVTAQEALQVLFHAYGLDSTIVGTTLFISLQERIKEMGLINRVIKLSNISAQDAEKMLKGIVEEITFNKDINAIVVTGTPMQIQEVERLITELDRPQPQVLLNAKVIEVDRDALKELGIDWSDAMTLNFQETKRPVDNTGENQIDSVAQAFKFFRMSRDPLKFSAILRMLVTQNRARILSNPQVTAMNEKEAEIFIGDRVPYTITTVTGGVASTEVRFVEAGIRLKITPSIIKEDFVVVTVAPEVSFIYAWRGPDDQYPWVRTREAKASVRIQNGQSFVLGGLISEEDKKNVYSLPFISKLPMLGNLFKYERNTSDKKELIIAVTPEIID